MGVWHTYSTRQTLSELETDKSRGLSGAEAERRLARWGPNRLEEGRRQGLLLRFLGQMKDPMILVLLAAAALSLWASGGEDWLDAAIILVIVVVNACISISQEDSAEKALEALRKMSAPLAKVVRDGALQRLETDRLVPGDIIHLEAGDLVPADARILEAASLQADESAMTGESVPVSKGLLSALPEDTPLAERHNMVLASTVLTRGPGALDRAELIQNYYGFAAPISGAELERQGIEGAKAVGVKFVTTEAVGLTYTDKLTVETLDGDYPADAVVLATGASRATPRIPGLAGLEGHGVSYCATCDAFFYRGKDVAVVGSGEYALHEVQALLPVAASVTLLLNGAPPAAEFPPEVAVRPEKIDAILGEQKVTGVQLSGGDVVELAGVFVALGVAGSTALARKIGAAVENGRIVTDEKMQTTVPGLYAAGDCTGGLLQVAKAVYEGALAGTEAAKALRKG